MQLGTDEQVWAVDNLACLGFVSGDIAAWVAAGAAVAAACIVSWQSWETRRSASASNRAADVALDGLRLSRQQINEAIRARIDAAMPTITVTTGKVLWPPLEPSVVSRGEAQPLPYGPDSPVLHLPRDAERRIAIRLAAKIRNDSTQHVRVSLNGLWLGFDQEIDLAPGTQYAGQLEASRTLREWVDIYTARSAGEPGAEYRASVVYLGPGDASANDSWTIVLGGTLVEPVPEYDSGWRVIAEPGHPDGREATVGAAVEPRARTYFLSKSRNERLVDV